ncbi:class I SAM-dependent methyltransferase [Yoonia sp. 2307UL14-13]|uniref:class I SAM-dependent methyltransferase n=1 Tax=Yoonia sp. 2307UL14-13 TaxID=3126506 RepID=UPI0030A5C744
MIDGGAITSPVTDGPCHLIKHVPTKKLIDLYRAEHGIDVSRFFSGLESIDLMQCDTTGYEFFHPFSVEGDPAFYTDLYSKDQSKDWAYSARRWEFDWVTERLDKTDRVLDVGCGSGEFLLGLSGKVARVRGLETSDFGCAEAAKAGLDVVQDTIQTHAIDNAGAYDVVTCFQVLEHIQDVGPFVESLITATAPGGKIIIAVPNNASFVGEQDELTLNFPPHHVGHWRRDSLAALAPALGLELIAADCEPLQEELIDWYKTWVERKYLPKSRLARSLYYRFGGSTALGRYLSDNRQTIQGHTVLAVFQRKEGGDSSTP